MVRAANPEKSPLWWQLRFLLAPSGGPPRPPVSQALLGLPPPSPGPVDVPGKAFSGLA